MLVRFGGPNEAIGENPCHPDDKSPPKGSPKGRNMNSIGDLTGKPKGESIDHQKKEPEGENGDRKG